MPRAEVIKRLRERGHPILLYGESEVQAFKRLRRIEIQEPEANRVRYTYIKNEIINSELNFRRVFILYSHLPPYNLLKSGRCN